MKLNQDKCHLIVSGHKYEKILASVGQSIIWETLDKKPFSIIIDRILKFNGCVTFICKKAVKKLICIS